MFSMSRKTALASIASIAIGASVMTIGLSSPASAAHHELNRWELGVTPSYGYGDDYPRRPRAVHEAPLRGSQRPDYGEATAKSLALRGLRDRD
jgi:hypothetical protein